MYTERVLSETSGNFFSFSETFSRSLPLACLLAHTKKVSQSKKRVHEEAKKEKNTSRESEQGRVLEIPPPHFLSLSPS
jgi:hypothetical protein